MQYPIENAKRYRCGYCKILYATAIGQDYRSTT